MKFSSYAITGALAAALALSACGEAGGPGERAPREATQVSQDEAQAGLAALNLADNPEISWGERSFEDGVYTFSELAFTPEDKAGEGFTVEQLVLAAPRVDEEGHVAFDRLEVLGLTGGETAGEQVRVARLFVDYPGPGLAQAIADMLSGRAGEEDYEAEIDDISRYTFAGIGIEGVEMAVQEEGEPVAISLTGFTLDDFDGERLAAMELSGLAMEGADAGGDTFGFSLAEMRVEGLKGSMLEGMAESGEDMEEALGAMSNWFVPTDLYENFVMRDLDVNAAGMLVMMPELTSQVRERGNEIVMTSDMPSLTVRGQEGTEGGAMVAQALTLLGYESFDFSMRGESVYDQDADRIFSRGENYFALEDGVRISVQSDLSGFQAYMDRTGEVVAETLDEAENGKAGAAGSDLEARMMEAYQVLDLHSLRIAIEDNSLLDRALDAAAQTQGVTREEVRSQVVGFIGMGVMMAPAEVPRPLITALSTALTDFVQEGGTVVIEAQPEEPVPLGTVIESIETGTFQPEQIGLEVSHQPAGGE